MVCLVEMRQLDGDRPVMSVIKIGLNKRANAGWDGIFPPALRVFDGAAGAARAEGLRRIRRFFSAFLSGTALSGFATAALAQDGGRSAAKLFSSTEVIISSLVVGALGAALLSAVWLVRQR